jgi:hypothetical protein
LREDAQNPREEKTTLEGMIQSRDELTLEMAKEYELNRMGENDDDEGEDGIFILIVEEEAPMENGLQELDDLDDMGDLDDDPNKGRSDMDEWFPQDGSNDRD